MIKPIRSMAQYKACLKRAYTLMQMNLKAKSSESDELELLSILIEKYEKEVSQEGLIDGHLIKT